MQCSSCVLSYSDTHVRMLEDCIQETILEQNKLAAGSDRSVSDNVKKCHSLLIILPHSNAYMAYTTVFLQQFVDVLQKVTNDSYICFLTSNSLFRLMAIQQCDLVLIHIHPQGEDTLVSDRPKKEVGSNKQVWGSAS